MKNKNTYFLHTLESNSQRDALLHIGEEQRKQKAVLA